LKQFHLKSVWVQEKYSVVKKNKQGKAVLDTDGNQMIETKFVAHDLA